MANVAGMGVPEPQESAPAGAGFHDLYSLKALIVKQGILAQNVLNSYPSLRRKSCNKLITMEV